MSPGGLYNAYDLQNKEIQGRRLNTRKCIYLNMYCDRLSCSYRHTKSLRNPSVAAAIRDASISMQGIPEGPDISKVAYHLVFSSSNTLVSSVRHIFSSAIKVPMSSDPGEQVGLDAFFPPMLCQIYLNPYVNALLHLTSIVLVHVHIRVIPNLLPCTRTTLPQ